jgi:hypothetical protein
MRVDKTQENLAHCRCLDCPSYSMVCRLKNAEENKENIDDILESKPHYEKMFCAFEKSNCIHLDRGCLCEQCSVHWQYALHKHEYCLKNGGL